MVVDARQQSAVNLTDIAYQNTNNIGYATVSNFVEYDKVAKNAEKTWIIASQTIENYKKFNDNKNKNSWEKRNFAKESDQAVKDFSGEPQEISTANEWLEHSTIEPKPSQKLVQSQEKRVLKNNASTKKGNKVNEKK